MSEPLLPATPTHAEYQALRPDGTRWLRVMQAICQQHHLPAERLERFGDGVDGAFGTNIVYAVGGDLVIKLYPPYWQRLYEAERAVGEHVHGKLSVTTPQIRAHGALDGWPYLVMDRLSGTPLADIWETLDQERQRALTLEVADVLSALHALPTDGLKLPAVNWPQWLGERMVGCVARQREQGTPDFWLQQMPDFLASALPLAAPTLVPAIVSGDVHQWHLFAEERQGRWRLTGLFDFDDALLGAPEYDLAATSLFLLAKRPALLRPFLLRSGYAAGQLNAALSHRLLAYTLLHRYRPFPWVLADYGDPACETLGDVAEKMYAL